MKQNLRSYVINLIGMIGLYAAMLGLMSAGILDRYYQGILMTVFINVILAVSLNLTTGLLGQIALGHAGFMSIGAYTAALLTKALAETLSTASPLASGAILLVALLLGGITAALFGLLIGGPVLRLKGDYLAIITLGFGEIIRVVIENLQFTGGAQGLRGIERMASLPMTFWITAVVVVLLFTLGRSRHGRAIISISQDEIASEAAGIHNTYYKIMAFTIAAFFAGIAGGIYAHYIGSLTAKTFGFNKSIDILVIVVFGGMGSLTGSIVAAVGLTILPELLREVLGDFTEYRMLLYAVALVIVMLFKPSGLFGRYEFSLTRVVDRLTGKGPKKSKRKEDAVHE
ncbi:MAG: branched-chain amino acid ABC transporter permease [Oscillospiraceae bacterium]|nr:branched-chain amino acid ABC transporter permease [Oscillospiraceae bacterium]